MEAAHTARREVRLDPVTTGTYRPRRPQDSFLYQLVQQHLETSLATHREACHDDDPIPVYVERAFRSFLECGIPAYGFARARCAACKHDFVVAFSCKTRGLCPSCNTRRMVETAAHLVDHVIPRVPVRQWVLTVPKRVRYFLLHDQRIFSGVLRVFMRAVNTAVRKHSPGAPRDASFGAVTFLHRAGSFLNEHPHMHSAVTDGVFAEGDEGLVEFYPASELTPEVVQNLQQTLRKRILGYLERHGRLDPGTVEDMLDWQHEGGFSLDASVRIDDWDRDALERLSRYCARPPFAAGRLAPVDEQTVAYELRKPTQDGRTCLFMDPLELMGRLAALIPPPRAHLVRYFGVLAPNAKLREQVVQTAGPSPALLERLCKAAECMGIEGGGGEADVELGVGPRVEAGGQAQGEEQRREEKDVGRRASRLWAMLIARVYEALPLLCPRCGQPMKIIAFITEPETVAGILEHLGLPATPPPIAPARGPPQEEFDLVDWDPGWD